MSAAAPSLEPPDIDAAVPPVSTDTECPLPDILTGASKRVEELINSLQQFSATERVEHQEPNGDGQWGKPKVVVFDYVVEFHKLRKLYLVLNETRNGGLALDKFPAHLATLGLPSIALVFHPMFIDDFEMRCEGATEWDGHPAWQIHFRQRDDRVSRLRSYRIKDRIFLLKLKGRAWIARDSNQLLHIDTDLVEPVPQIMLKRDQLSVNYKPVHFKKDNIDLWLPDTAEAYMDFHGQRFRRRHSFSQFLLFSVDTEQHDAMPPAETGAH